MKGNCTIEQGGASLSAANRLAALEEHVVDIRGASEK